MAGLKQTTGGKLKIDGVSLSALAKQHGTPLYIYSHATLVENFKRIQRAFAPCGAIVAYAMKSNSNGAVLRALVKEGAGMDIVSSGELQRALAAGVDPQKVIFAGVGKTEPEITLALKSKIRAFNVESEAEAEAIAGVAARLKKRAPIWIRVNPDVDAATHHYIATGKKDNKFGIAFDGVRRLLNKLAAHKSLRIAGLQTHIGSQITTPESHLKAMDRMIELLAAVRRDGHKIENLSLGGGFGIAYEEGSHPMDVAALAAKMLPKLKTLNVQIFFEPGRAISGPAGFLLTRVLYLKPGKTKNFAIIDGAMNDLIRPALYSAYHRILLDGGPRRGKKVKYDVVGPVCESGDFLGKDREFAGLAAGDLLLVCDAGAYGMVMASNYNSRPRPAEVMIKSGKAHVIRERETLAQVIGSERIPAFLKR